MRLEGDVLAPAGVGRHGNSPEVSEHHAQANRSNQFFAVVTLRRQAPLLQKYLRCKYTGFLATFLCRRPPTTSRFLMRTRPLTTLAGRNAASTRGKVVSRGCSEPRANIVRKTRPIHEQRAGIKTARRSDLCGVVGVRPAALLARRRLRVRRSGSTRRRCAPPPLPSSDSRPFCLSAAAKRRAPRLRRPPSMPSTRPTARSARRTPRGTASPA